MRALFFDGKQQIRIGDIPVPKPGMDDVLVRVLHSAVCQTEFRYYFGEGSPGVLGHEFVGQVEAVGPNVGCLSAGDVVMCYPSLPCGKCIVRRAGKSNVCLQRKGLRGGFAEYLSADAGFFLKIPEDFANRYGVLLYDVFGLVYRGMQAKLYLI
jgi:threonine dehydrogenase-like Zn-dependent dehydrogenase